VNAHVTDALESLAPEDMLELCCEALLRVPGLTEPQRRRILQAMVLEVDLPEAWSPDRALPLAPEPPSTEGTPAS
jgi:hypothetical protein